MAYRGMRLEALIDEIMAEVGIHEYGRIDMHPNPSKMSSIVAHLKEYQPKVLEGQPVASVSTKDGTKLLFEDSSWLLLRPSGTEPVVRVYAESSSQERVKALLDAGTGVVNGV
jgi:phosphomannomutase